jgi:histidyl-tRNA synthetase
MTDTGITFAAPRGMRDFYPEDMVVRNRIFDAWKKAGEAFGFLPYDSCVVESLDLLKRKSGEEIVDQIYNFADKSGRPLALRPEMTPTLARMIVARQSALSLPIKWTTIAQCFRYERMTRGRKREHYQWNLDIVGEPSVGAEAEIIAAAAHALGLMGLGPGDICVHFNSRGLISDLLEKLGIPAERHSAIYLVLDKKGKITDDEMRTMLAEGGLEPGAVDAVNSLFRVGSLEEARAILGTPTPSLERLLALEQLLRGYGLGEVTKFDIAVIRGLSYYTGIVFEAFDTQGGLRAIFGGGRYDNLLGDLGGRPMTAVGLGFGDVVVAELLEARGKLAGAPSTSAELAIGFMQEEQRPLSISLAAARRRAGLRVDLALAPEKPKGFFARAGKSGFRSAIYIGPDDVQKGAVRIKDLASFSQTEVSVSDLLNPPHP